MVDESRINKEKYNKKDYITLTRWNSYYHQIMLPLQYHINDEPILEIGVGNGFVTNSIWGLSNYKIWTMDINPDLKPEVVGDVRDIPWEDNMFGTTLCYEVLEHLPYKEIDTCLKEIHRVTKNIAIISLPYSGASFTIYSKLPFLKGRILRIPSLIKRPVKLVDKIGVQHYWTLGEIGTSIKQVKKKIESHGFKVIEQVTPEVNPHHIFFVCEVLNE
jgi:ubiquinone/menaquinone biosynthesis C-methylase UbiE